jgi:uncharacterized damage-inducible protein DinB
MDLLARLLGHDYWATNRILTEAATLSPQEFAADLPEGWGSLAMNLTHHIWVVGMWTDLMSGRPMPPRPIEPLSLTDLVDLHDRNHAAFRAFAESVYAEGRQDETFLDHHGVEYTLGSTINQVMHHNTEHRHEDRQMLRRLGVEEIWEGDPQGYEWQLGNR